VMEVGIQIMKKMLVRVAVTKVQLLAHEKY